VTHIIRAVAVARVDTTVRFSAQKVVGLFVCTGFHEPGLTMMNTGTHSTSLQSRFSSGSTTVIVAQPRSSL
jgi:hypothetical protein